MSIKCIALDMDRTTLDLNGRLSAANRRAIESAIAQGIHIVMASGRAYSTLPRDVVSIKGLEYAITSNGAAVYYIPENRCLQRFTMTPESIDRILELTSEFNVTYEAFIDGYAYGETKYVNNPVQFGGTKYAARYIKMTRRTCDNVIELLDINKSSIESLAIIVNEDGLKDKLTDYLMANVPDIYATSSVSRLLEISNINAGKKNGLKFVMEQLGLKREEIAAFGDGDNDAEMLEFVGTGIAMENATPKCLVAADTVTLHHKDNGLEYGMREILKIDVMQTPEIIHLKNADETAWINKGKLSMEDIFPDEDSLSQSDIDDAELRLQRFAPLIAKCFPETVSSGGIIESELTPIPKMKDLLNDKYGAGVRGGLFLKQDNALAVAGSVKARGGIYEVLRHAEDLALKNGLITNDESYETLASDKSREFFNQYKIQVGSTGNLGMSIGIMSAALGFQVIVHMSADAKQWKKDLLRSRGVTVIEYPDDYSEAVKNGRAESDIDSMSYFIDDENSKDLFLGYATAAGRLDGQLKQLGITVDDTHPLFVYIPCGVGGAPGGITFGLRQLYGDNVHCFFAEPVQAPCMMAGMATGLYHGISVQDLGLTGVTHADGLAVGRSSGFVGKYMIPHLSGIFTVKDHMLYEYMRDLSASESVFIEPSSCAAFECVIKMNIYKETQKYLSDIYHKIGGINDKDNDNSIMVNHSAGENSFENVRNFEGNITHIVWATGGSLVPDEERRKYSETFLPENE